MTREQKLKAVWRNTHRDFKGIIDGKKYVLVLREGGTQAVQLDQLTDAELARFTLAKIKGTPAGVEVVPIDEPATLHNVLKQIVGE
jgi:hypothetical protein